MAGLLVLALFIVDENRIAGLRAAVRSSDPHVRGKALTRIANERERRAFDAVVEELETEVDRELLEKAGYATMRLGDPRGFEPLRKRAAASEPDDRTHGKLIIYTARLSGQDVRLAPWLETGLKSPQRWERLASAIGLLELGRPEAGGMLVDWLPGLDPDLRQFAVGEFRKRIGEPITQAAGAPLDWQGLEDAPPGDPRWAQLREFWRNHASARLLNDVLSRQDHLDPDWILVKRLLHARDRVARWLF